MLNREMEIPLLSENPSLKWYLTYHLDLSALQLLNTCFSFYYSKVNCSKASATVLIFYFLHLEHNDLNVSYCSIQTYWVNSLCNILFLRKTSLTSLFFKINYHKIYKKKIKEL